MRLIDADALTKEAGRLWSEMPDGVELSKELMKAINHAPTVEQEADSTTWIKEEDRTNHWHCAKCGFVEGVTARMHKFCPECGRKVKWDEP